MKIKVSEAEGAVLSWMVAMCEGAKYSSFKFHCKYGVPLPEYSAKWSEGGPIIEREKIYVRPYNQPSWIASYQSPNPAFAQGGPTFLIAAMRCYVASKLGDEVDVPEELLYC